MEFKYNKDAKYPTGPSFNTKSVDLNLTLAVNQRQNFRVKLANPLQKYLNPPIKNDSTARNWFHNPHMFFQNQLNFAVYCATTGCGVSYANHLNHPDLLVRSVYGFHFYYCTRRILSELSVPLPNEPTFNHFNNRMNLKAYERISNEFGLSTNTDWRQNLDANHGMGNLYLLYSRRVYNYAWWDHHTSFNHRARVILDSIEQSHGNAWTTFILDQSKGFTQAGVVRLNDSIRTYVWCLLGAQSQTRTSIIDKSTGFDAEKQFLVNLEDAINSVVDLPHSIERYQDVLRYARSKVDFVIGSGLYMMPSDLRLQMGTIKNYNNLILVADNNQLVGKNERLNENLITVHHNTPVHALADAPPVPSKPVESIVNEQRSKSSHEDEKTALIILLTFGGLIGLYLSK